VDGAHVAVDRLWPDRPARITELGGGITNRNFKVEVEGGVFVLRMGGARTELLGIDRAVEYAAGTRAYEVGVGPEVVEFVRSEGWLVARFVDGSAISPAETRKREMRGRIAAALRRFHDSPAIPGRFDSHAVVEDYHTKAVAHGVSIPAEFDDAHDISERIRAARGPQAPVPCHNDLLNANFIDDGDIRIVDWEYAGMGDRFFDLGNLSANARFDEGDDEWLLTAYFNEPPTARRFATLRLMRLVSDFREAMWGVLQSGISELDFDFDAYAAKHFARLEAHAEELAI